MTTRLLSDIVQTVRDRGDYRNPVKFTDEIITREIQAAFAELYQLITDVNEGYFDTYATLTTRSNVAFVALPSDSWRVRAIDLIDSSGNPISLDQVGIDQRNNYGTIAGRPVAYRLTARGVDLYPTPDQAYTLRLLYTPSAPDLRVPVFVGSSDATFALDGSSNLVGTMTVPSGVVAGDTMLMVVMMQLSEMFPTVAPDGWYSVASIPVITGADTCAIVYRRVADGSEAASYAASVGNGTGDNVAGMVMLVYRNLDPLVDVIDSSAVKVASSSSFVCPSLTLTSAMDMYLGIGWDVDGATTFTKPFGSTLRFSAAQRSDGVTARQLATFDIQTGIIGASPVQTMRSSSSVTSGVAMGLLFAVNPFREYYNGWEEYIVYGACIRLSGEEESTRSDWVTLQDRARQLAVHGATGRRSAEPQLIPLMDDGW